MAAHREILVGHQFNKSHRRRRFVEWIKGWIHRRKIVGGEAVFSTENDFAICFDGACKPLVAFGMIGIRAGENHIKYNGFGAIGSEPFDQLCVDTTIPWTVIRLLQLATYIIVHIDHY